ncbi:MAG: imelysin family protein [Myxococcota bacterium]
MNKAMGKAQATSWGVLVLAAGLIAVQPMGCLDVDEPQELDAEGTGDYLADLGSVVIVPTVDAFLVEVDALDSTLQDLQADPSTLSAAQAQWRTTMAAWQELEVMQIGPAASSLTDLAGEDLRDEIYSWPTINACRVDQETVAEGWENADFFETRLVNSYGLDAIEHLLFAPLENACPGQIDINSDGTWDALGDVGVADHRARYAVALIANIRTQGEAIRDVWAVDGQDFSATIAADDGGPYGSRQEALNAIYDAMFYLEKITKDRKLAQPIGLRDCSEQQCPEDVEGLISGSGLASIEANLIGFELLFTGGDGAGMDDLLIEVGEEALSEEILTNLAAAQAQAASMEGPLDVAIVERPEEVQALHDSIKAVADILKGDMATVLLLQIPDEAAGDND